MLWNWMNGDLYIVFLKGLGQLGSSSSLSHENCPQLIPHFPKDWTFVRHSSGSAALPFGHSGWRMKTQVDKSDSLLQIWTEDIEIGIWKLNYLMVELGRLCLSEDCGVFKKSFLWILWNVFSINPLFIHLFLFTLKTILLST